MEPVLETNLALTAEEASTYSTILEAVSLLPRSDPRYSIVIGVTWWLLHRRRRLEQSLVRRRHFSRRLRRIMTMRWHLQKNTLHGLASAFEATEQALLQQLDGLPEKRLWVNKERTDNFWSRLSKGELSAEEYPQNFHMSQETFSFIYSQLEEHLQKAHTTMREPLPPKKRFAATLFRLATNAEYTKVGNLFGIGKSTTTSLVKDVCEVIVSNLKSFLSGGITAKSVSEAVRRFKIPKVAGVLGSTDVFIPSPLDVKNNVSSYSSIYAESSSSPYGLVFQALVDHRGHFCHISASNPSGMRNIDVLKKSSLDEFVTTKWSNETNDILVLADQSYRECSYSWLLTPSKENLKNLNTDNKNSQDEKIHNGLKVFEESVSKLRSRWKIFHGRNGKINFNPDGFENVALACCILHNICEQREDFIDPNWTAELDDSLFLRNGIPVGNNDKSMNDNDDTSSHDNEGNDMEEDLIAISTNAIRDALFLPV